MSTSTTLIPALAALLLLTGCTTGVHERSPEAPTPPVSAEPTPPATADTPDDDAPDEAVSEADAVAGTTVRFASDDAQVDVTIGSDTPAARDFLSMLPLTLELEEFSGREKIAYLPRELDTEGTPGSDPEDGDLIYYVPWGNLGFYYDASGIGPSDDVLHIGTYDATRELLDRLEGANVRVTLAE